MSRVIAQCPARVRSVPVPVTDVVSWLDDQATRLAARYLLAHADDGVIWGRYDGGRLVTSHEVTAGMPGDPISPPLRSVTLQQARVFGGGGELHLWREGPDRFSAREIVDCTDAEATWREAIDEPYLLWGTQALELGRDFTLFMEGSLGIRHAVPVVIPRRSGIPRPALLIRHYLQENEIGINRIVVSRLVGVQIAGKEASDD